MTSVSLLGVDSATGSILGGTWIDIEGSGFGDVTQVYFGTNPAMNFTLGSNNQMQAESPAGGGDVDVTVVSTSRGQSLRSSGDKFQYAVVPPEIDYLEDASGPQTGGSTVYIFGENFEGTSVVTIGGFEATSFNVLSSGEISAVVPAGAPGMCRWPCTQTKRLSLPCPIRICSRISRCR